MIEWANLLLLLAVIQQCSALVPLVLDANNNPIGSLLEVSVQDILILKFSATSAPVYEIKPSADANLPTLSSFCNSSTSTLCDISLFKPTGIWASSLRAQCFQDVAGSTTAGILVFQPTLDQAGSFFLSCVEMYAAGQTANASLACANISVIAPAPVLTNVTVDGVPLNAPSVDSSGSNWYTIETAAGCKLRLSFTAKDTRNCKQPGCVVHSTSAAPASCAMSNLQSTSCVNACGMLEVVPRPVIGEAYPVSATGLPAFAVLQPDGAAQYSLYLAPTTDHSSQMPHRLCLSAAMTAASSSSSAAGSGAAAGPGSLCLSIAVGKCRHCPTPGLTLRTMGEAVGVDWLQVFLANPAMSGHDPSVLTPSVSSPLRLGVLYRPSPGETLASAAARLLVPKDTLLKVNPELWSAARVRSKEGAAGRTVHLLITFTPRRALCGRGAPGCGYCFVANTSDGAGGSTLNLCSRGADLTSAASDTVTVALQGGFKGPTSWTGNVTDYQGTPEAWDAMPEPCAGAFQQECPVQTVGDACDCSSLSPGTHCAAGGWGACRYDDTGRIRCMGTHCPGEGMHPLLESASWDGTAAALTFTVRAGVRVEAGTPMAVVVPKTAGILFPTQGSPDATRDALAVLPFPGRADALAGPLPSCAQVAASSGGDDPQHARPCTVGAAQSLRFPQAPYEVCAPLLAGDARVQCVLGEECSMDTTA